MCQNVVFKFSTYWKTIMCLCMSAGNVGNVLVPHIPYYPLQLDIGQSGSKTSCWSNKCFNINTQSPGSGLDHLRTFQLDGTAKDIQGSVTTRVFVQIVLMTEYVGISIYGTNQRGWGGTWIHVIFLIFSCDMWQVTQVTHDTWHVTHDTWRGVNILSKFQLSSADGLGITVYWTYWD